MDRWDQLATSEQDSEKPNSSDGCVSYKSRTGYPDRKGLLQLPIACEPGSLARARSTRPGAPSGIRTWLCCCPRTPKQAISFNIGYPAAHMTKILFPLLEAVDAMSFDGHFGVHRGLCPSDPPRTERLKGQPRKKILREHDAVALAGRRILSGSFSLNELPAGTFAVDPSIWTVLGAVEHVQHENNKDKVRLLKAVMNMDQVEADLLIHDDICHFQEYASQKKHAPDFSPLRYYVVDAFHAPNHKCSNSTWTAVEQSHCRNVRTSVSESFNAWLRRLNFFLNNLRPKSHRFRVEQMCNVYNTNLQPVPIRISRHRTVLGRVTMFHLPGAVQSFRLRVSGASSLAGSLCIHVLGSRTCSW